MQETRNSNALLILFGTRAHLFSPDEGSCFIFSIRNNCCEFFTSYGVIFKVIFNHTWKRQFVVLIFHITKQCINLINKTSALAYIFFTYEGAISNTCWAKINFCWASRFFWKSNKFATCSWSGTIRTRNLHTKYQVLISSSLWSVLLNPYFDLLFTSSVERSNNFLVAL